MEITIKAYNSNDIPRIAAIWNEIIDEGTTLHWINHLSESEVENFLTAQTEVNCAFADNKLAGFYLLRPNYIGRCSHIANAMYAVAGECRQKGIGTKLVEHSLETARKLGFSAMQFNLVVETNPAIGIYKRLGFEQVGKINNGFLDINNKYQNLLLLYKSL